jgi:hypothetical protein
VDTKETFESSPAPTGPVWRFKEPQVEAAARLTPAFSSADGTAASISDVATSQKADRPLPITSNLLVTAG